MMSYKQYIIHLVTRTWDLFSINENIIMVVVIRYFGRDSSLPRLLLLSHAIKSFYRSLPLIRTCDFLIENIFSKSQKLSIGQS